MINRFSIILFGAIALLIAIIVIVVLIISPKTTPLSVVSSSPSDKLKEVSVDSTVSIIFNKKPQKENVRFTIEPQIDGLIEISGNTYIFKPDSPLSKSMIYIVTLGLLDQKPTGVYGFTFQTEGPPPDFPHTTEPSDFVQNQEEFQKQNSPDVFLVNKTPYSNNDFSINSTFTQTPKDHFYFSINLKGANKDRSKEAFLDWLKSFGMTDAQISTLDIRYN